MQWLGGGVGVFGFCFLSVKFLVLERIEGSGEALTFGEPGELGMIGLLRGRCR